jgi:drug/metabolite transporter (DMT)-like permease
VLGATLCFAQATVLVRHFPPVHAVTLNAVGMATGAAILTALSLLLGESIELPQRTETWTALAYLVAVGSGLVFVLYVVVIRFWSASRAAYGFVVTGGLLVLAGVYAGALRPDAPRVAPAD